MSTAIPCGATKTTRTPSKSGLANKLIATGTGIVLGVVGATANADQIQIANMTERPDITSYSAVLDARAENTGTTLGYDSGIDHNLDTSTNPEDYASLIYSELIDTSEGLHAVDYNFSTETNIGDTYTMKLSFENEVGNDFYSLMNSVVLTDFNINNSNGVNDYEYVLSVNTDGYGSGYDFTTSGLLSEVWATQDKKLGEWSQGIPQAIDWRQGRTYGELTLTATGIPEPSVPIGLLGLGGAALLGAGRNLTRKQKAIKL